MKKATKRWFLLLVVGLGALFGLTRVVDVKTLLSIFKSSNPYLIAIAMLLNGLVIYVKGLRWRELTLPFDPKGAFESFRITALAFFGNSILPARAGEFGRAYYLSRDGDIPLKKGISIGILDKFMDFAGLVPFFLVFLWHTDSAIMLLKNRAYLISLLLVTVITAGLISLYFRRKDFLLAVTVIEEIPGPHLAKSFLYTVISWTVQIVMIYACGKAIGIELKLWQVITLLIGINALIFLPNTPSNVGTLHFAIMVVMDSFGFTKEKSLALAIIYHGIQVISISMMALPSIHRLKHIPLQRLDTKKKSV